MRDAPNTTVRSDAVVLTCSGCGYTTSIGLPLSRLLRCPRARDGDGIDHVLRRTLERSVSPWPAADDNAQNPFVRYRWLLSAAHLGQAGGLDDPSLRALIEQLDGRVAEVDGRGFVRSPCTMQPALAAALGLGSETLWVKDETHAVSGSHKARHLTGVMLALLVERRLRQPASGRSDRDALPAPGDDGLPGLAIASCGNAALAAAVVASAARWPLSVYVPPDAERSVLDRLRELEARIHIYERDGKPGDPCYRAFRAAVARGEALPFCCQGPDCSLTIEGGQTLVYELVDQLARREHALDALIVQVGGGALGSACYQGLREAQARGALSKLPRIYTVQTEGGHPLRRAYRSVVSRWRGRQLGDHEIGPRTAGQLQRSRDGVPPLLDALAAAARERSAHMRPWETEPQSAARGILDDESYDWHALVEAMIDTGGYPLVAPEATVRRAHALVVEHTEIPASATGTAGVAGLIQLCEEGGLQPGERVGVLLTGRER